MLLCTGMIVNNAPAIGKTLQHKAKDPSDVAGLPFQVPLTEHKRGPRPQRAYLQA